ncbi:CAMK protein kinase [Magnaporthiopsis poae ATCC 64411]|uniref:EKC/KEOPS complex subunit BUD32 n=1 Tax=Magnaporthiopsis poae (strain ATCC 64411 / 73-15) TaxID=644358 RepID=A0A0C4E8W5_MAGP6|nr:CAMK protein kinase [Magnaporthiopsis poae ATCC 64411]
MADLDSVAYLYPAEVSEKAREVIKNPLNQSRFLPPRRRETPSGSTIPTSAQDSDDDETQSASSREHDPLAFLPCLEIRLDVVPRGHHGIVAGCDPSADIVLPKMQGISYHHFSITFNDDYRLIVKDLGSQRGTAVLYDRPGERQDDERPRTGVEWIVGGDDFLKDTNSIAISVLPTLRFQIVARSFDRNSEAFRAKVDKFRAGSGGLEEMLEGAGIRPATRLPTAAQTPTKNKLTLTKYLGQGGFATVRQVWDASTGRQYVCKQPREDKQSDGDLEQWRNEASLMRHISHPGIVKLLGFREGPPPSLELEYVEGGSLQGALRQKRLFSAVHCIQILRQTTSALAHLHARNITHRDISPGNILIKRFDSDEIIVKLGDLGQSKGGPELNTRVGTPPYRPPEFHGSTGRYTKYVDIWSLGVVLAQLKCGLPDLRSGLSGRPWCEAIRKRLEECQEKSKDELVAFLLESMLCMEPEKRRDAKACHGASLTLRATGQDAPVGARGCSGGHGSDHGASTIRGPRLAQVAAATCPPRLARDDAKPITARDPVKKSSGGTTPTQSAFEESESEPSAPPPPATVSEVLPRVCDPCDSGFGRLLGEVSHFSDDPETASRSVAPQTPPGQAARFSGGLETAPRPVIPQMPPAQAEDDSRKPTSLFGENKELGAPTPPPISQVSGARASGPQVSSAVQAAVPRKRPRELESPETSVLRLKDFENESQYG